MGTVRGAFFQLLREIHRGMHWLGIAFATKSAACSVEKLLAVQRVDSHSVAKLLPDVSAFLADSGVQEAITRGHPVAAATV